MRVLVVSLLFLFSCGTQQIANYKSGSTSLNEEIEGNALDSLIHPYKEGMETEMNKVIGYASIDLEKRAPESPLSNFAAEAVHLRGYDIGVNSRAFGPNAMKNAFTLLNFGGLRAPINQGEIILGELYELMPFDNTLVLVQLNAEQARACAKYLFEMHGQPVFNAKFRLSSNLEQMWIGEEEYLFDKDIIIITSDYLAGGGDKMNFLTEPIRKYDSGIFLRDIFIERVKELDTLGTFEDTGKFHFVKE